MEKRLPTSDRRPGASAVAPARRRVVVRVAASIALVLIVASLAFWMWGRVAVRLWWHHGLVEAPALPPLPAYGLELSARPGRDALRERAPTVRLVADAVLTVIARPAEAVVGPVEARAFLSRDGERRPWAVAFERTEMGSLVLSAPPRDLPELARGGRWDLEVIVGRPGVLPAALDAAPGQRSSSPDGRWALLRGTIEIVPDARAVADPGGEAVRPR